MKQTLLTPLIFLTLLFPQLLLAQCEDLPTVPENCLFTPIGHRGLSHLYPENSLMSLEQAFRHGVKYCEVDVSLTEDGTYVLFHDRFALHRTTFAQGRIDEISGAEAVALDNGSYKDTLFSFSKIPTLVDALKVAEKYDATLYLDTKSYSAQAMKDALDEAGVSPTRLAPSLESVGQAEEYRALLPESPWVWYGGGLFPDDAADPNFYTSCINLGCIAFEVSRGEVGNSPEWFEFEAQVHNAGSKVWAFTTNDYDEALNLISFGVDGIETDRPTGLAIEICANEERQFPDSLTTGNWRFTNSMANTLGVGSQIRPLNYEGVTPDQLPSFASCQEFGIAPLGTSQDSVMLIPAQNADNGILAYTNSSVENEGSEDFTYTILLDFLLPESSVGKWTSIYQTSSSNANDGELFINPDGQIGIIGDYFGDFQPNTWYRVGIVYDGDNQLLHLYQDGVLIGTVETFSNRWAIFNSAPPGENQGVFLFTDEDNETSNIYLSALQLRDYAMTTQEVQNLGGVNPNGFPSHNADLYLPTSTDIIEDSTLLDYDTQTYYCVLKEGIALGSHTIEFLMSARASSVITSGSQLDFSSGSANITINAADGNTKEWTICLREKAPVSISDPYVSETIAPYPNPTSQLLNYDDDIYSSWILFDASGRRVATGSVSPINVRFLHSGYYLLQLTQPNSSVKAYRVSVVQ